MFSFYPSIFELRFLAAAGNLHVSYFFYHGAGVMSWVLTLADQRTNSLGCSYSPKAAWWSWEKLFPLVEHLITLIKYDINDVLLSKSEWLCWMSLSWDSRSNCILARATRVASCYRATEIKSHAVVFLCVSTPFSPPRSPGQLAVRWDWFA